LKFNANWGLSEIESLKGKNISKFKIHHYSAGAMFFVQDWRTTKLVRQPESNQKRVSLTTFVVGEP
jgi:hypothetical protein